MAKIILDGFADKLAIHVPAPRFMRALTSGGLGELPGDAGTADIEENEAQRIEVSRAMPFNRAMDNMIAAGYRADFSERYLNAMLTGGQTDATALDLVRTHASPGKDDQVAAEAAICPPTRQFRDAWRLAGGKVVLDEAACRKIFLNNLLHAKATALKDLAAALEELDFLGTPDSDLEAQFAALAAMNLRSLGDQVRKVAKPEELLALWPAGLKWPGVKPIPAAA